MEVILLAKAVSGYWRRMLPLARLEINRWADQATIIDDPGLRQIAVAKIATERQNVESAAFFAVLAGPDWRRIVRRLVAFQLAYELLDGINEQQPALADGLRIHGALVEAVGGPPVAHNAGDYLQALVDACGAITTSSAALLVATADIGEAQARNHADDGLKAWAEAHAPQLRWWEAAAAGISSLGVLAMLASPPEHHAPIGRAYVEICALSALLDGLVDLPVDGTSNRNWLRYYRSQGEASRRLAALAVDAERSIAGLPGAPIHRLILAGLLAHNLVPHTTRQEHAQEIRRLLSRFPYVRAGMLLLRARRWLG
jgi:tetraprenyl-beta-curcumene synthase